MSDGRETVERYIDRSGALDADGLASCFVDGAGLYGYLGPQAVIGTIELYLADVKRLAAASTDMSAYSATINSHEATGQVARATVLMEGFAGVGFTDHLLLMQIAGEWKIISKAFTTRG